MKNSKGKKVKAITLFLCIKPTETEKNNGYVVFNEISPDQLGKRVRGETGTPTAPTPFYRRLLNRYVKTT
jgi:hypothetical protein